MQIDSATAVAAAVVVRHRELISILCELDVDEILAPSLLPGWTRLTVVCHLRYGAEANLAMTRSVLSGQPASFYPAGRTTQRPITLNPRAGEQAGDVIRSLVAAATELDSLWTSLDNDDWNIVSEEPADNVDLGSVALGTLALLRLTEVEVHGSDLDIGAREWSEVFVDTALPMRVHWLSTRRSNHSPTATDVHGTWVLEPHHGPRFAITASESGVSISEDGSDAGDARIAGSKRELLAFLLGRTTLLSLSVSGDHEFAWAFKRAFPSP